jgi:hypothetical protein
MAVGFLTFFVGVGLLLLTFKLAYDMFSVRPEVAMGTQAGTGIDVARAGESLASVLVRFGLLLIMAIVGSMIANRGIKLYVSARHIHDPKPERAESERPEPAISSQ